MIFIESADFTEHVRKLLSDDSYAEFQQFLCGDPKAGDVIQGTGGLRKIRWTDGQRGKRGGVRGIYFYVVSKSQIRLLLIYAKTVKDNLTAAEKRILRKLNEEW